MAGKALCSCVCDDGLVAVTASPQLKRPTPRITKLVSVLHHHGNPLPAAFDVDASLDSELMDVISENAPSARATPHSEEKERAEHLAAFCRIRSARPI
jgi:hypothetical protein